MTDPAPPDHVRDHPWGVRLFHAANAVYCRGFHQLRLLSPPRLPGAGAAILICNHTSGLDPVLIQSVIRRPVVWMMAREFYEIPFLKPLMAMIEAIPVERGSRETGPTRAAMRALKAGRVLGIFPEGRIEGGRNLLPFEPGVAVMAARAGAPIFPAYLDGTMRGLDNPPAFGLPQEATLAFGPRIDPPQAGKGRRADPDALVRTLEAAVRSLQNAAGPGGFDGAKPWHRTK